MRMIGFIVNPVSGNGRGLFIWNKIAARLERDRIPHTIAFTTMPSDAVRHAERLAESSNVTAVVAVGGDGTVHEAANGLYRAGSDKPLGYIPAGSGNDFARGFGIPSDPEEALQLVLQHEPATRRIDLLQLQQRIAVNSIGAGFDGTIARMTNDAGYKKWLNRFKLGKLAYVWSLVRTLTSYKPCSITVSIDGTEHVMDKVWMITTANIPYMGGGMMICPDADASDSLAEICVVSGIGRLELLAVFPRVYNGTHTRHPAVRFFQGRHIAIRSTLPLDLHMDGEAAGSTPVALEVLPAALSVIAPTDSKA